MALDAVFFDLGDTLFDFAPVDPRAVFEQGALSTYDYLKRRGHSLPPFRRYFRMHYNAVRWAYLWAFIRRREFDTLGLVRRLCRRMNVPMADGEAAHLAWLCYQPLIDHTTVADDVIETLQFLQAQGLKLALISNTFVPPFALDKHLEMTGLLPFFPVRVYSSEVRYRKPHRRIFQIALERSGVSADRTLFVGDIIRTDMKGARRVGMTTVLRQPGLNGRRHRTVDYAIQHIGQLRQIIAALMNGQAMAAST